MSWPTNPGYKPGDWKEVCDICGFYYYGSQIRLRWDNMHCCPQCWDPRNPLDLLRVPKDDQAVRDARPQTPDRFTTNYLDPIYQNAFWWNDSGANVILFGAGDYDLLVWGE